jgi:hypothetical protein
MSSYDTIPNDTRVKVGHLVTGLVFLGIAGSWALRASGTIGDVTVGWLFPVILVGAGAIGLLAMLAGGVRRNRPAPASTGTSAGTGTPVDETTDTTADTGDTDDTVVIHKEEAR